MFTSMCVPSAYLADSSVAESAGGSLKPPEAARGVCKLYLFGAPASLSRHLGWISSEGEFEDVTCTPAMVWGPGQSLWPGRTPWLLQSLCGRVSFVSSFPNESQSALSS